MATSSMDLIKLMAEPPTQLSGHANKEIVEYIQFTLRHNPSSMCKFNWVQIIGNQAAHNLASWGEECLLNENGLSKPNYPNY
ncbi:hypothetical protein CFP56_030555 [Quercus suber]|uniref:RNase H type-1 domain-containing protein n=1 Tax=Quercus suber TaxID=58331 RepID=A0AAW0JPU1_QUESU